MRMPTLLTLPPSRFLLRLVSIDLLTLTLALGMGVSWHGDPRAYTGEGDPVTWLSFAHLLASGGLAGVVFRLRTHGRPPLCGWRDPRWFWLLLALGFLFLAVDEVALLHESFDRSAHRILGLQETALSDRLDDVIVLGYGVLGVAVLYVYRTELAAYREVLPLVTCGAILFLFMQGLDMVGNRDDVLRAVGVPDEGVGILRSWLGGIEEALKLCAEAALLGSVYTCAYITAAHRN